MVRIEIHLDKTETDILDAIAKEDGRSRKNLCETQIRKLSQATLDRKPDRDFCLTVLRYI